MKSIHLVLWLVMLIIPLHSKRVSAVGEDVKTKLSTLEINGSSISYRVKELLTDLHYPWSIAELPDGNLLITEKSGALKHLSGDGEVTVIDGLPEVYFKSQGGLLDIVLHPDFAKTQQLFISYAYGNDDANTTRIMRAKLNDNVLIEQKVLFEVQPYKDTPVHYGGRLATLPDETVVMTTGDGFDYREQAQKLNSLLGKTVRVTFNGEIPNNNPLVANQSARAEIYTYGHRNPQGLVYDAVKEKLWMHEHGPAGGDEINLLEAGVNYGWPVATKGKDYSGAVISPFDQYPGMRQPEVNWTPSIAPSGLDIYRHSAAPQLSGALLVGALVDRCLYLVFPEQGFRQVPMLKELNYRIRDVLVRENGNILVLTDSDQGKLLEVSFD